MDQVNLVIVLMIDTWMQLSLLLPVHQNLEKYMDYGEIHCKV